MANDYRGNDTAAGSSGFVGIDDTIVGDGSSATATRPCSTYLYNRALGNLMKMAAGMHQTGWSPVVANNSLTTGTGDRPYAALDWISIGVWDIPVSLGFQGVRINGIYNVQSVGTTQPDVLLRVDLGTASKTVTLTNTDNAGSADYQVMGTALTTIEVTLPNEVSSDNEVGYMPLRVWMRSKEGDSRATTDSVQGQGYYVDGGAAGFFTDSAGGNPDADSLEVQYLYVTAGGQFTGQTFDMLGQVNGTTGEAMAIVPGNLIGTVTVQRYYMSYLQLRGVWVQPLFNAASIVDIPADDIESSKTVSGPVLANLFDGIKRLYERPRIVGFGPRGTLDTAHEEYQGIDYCERWPFVEGDAAATVIINECVKLDTDNPVVEIILNTICVHHRQNTTPLVADDFGLNKRLDGSSEWTLELLVDQRANVESGSGPTDWASDNTNKLSATVSLDVKVPMYPASHFAEEPFLRQMAQAETFDGTTNLAFSYKEGCLYERDLKLIQPIKLVGKLTGFAGSTNDRMVRVRVRAVLKSGSTPVYTSSQWNETQYLRFVVAGYTIIERGIG